MTSQQLMKLVLEESEIISDKIKRLEQLSAQIEQANRNHLEQLKRADIKVDNSGVNRSVAELERVAEKAVKSIQTTQKGFNWMLYCASFCLISLFALVLIYKKGIETKIDIKEEYRKELSEKGQYNTIENAEFLRKFRVWIDKNPNDSNDLFRKVEKME